MNAKHSQRATADPLQPASPLCPARPLEISENQSDKFDQASDNFPSEEKCAGSHAKNSSKGVSHGSNSPEESPPCGVRDVVQVQQCQEINRLEVSVKCGWATDLRAD